VVVVTRKAVDLSIARSVAAVLARRTPAPVSIVALLPGGLVLGDARQPLSVLRRQRTLAIAAIGNAEAFRRQLEQAGAVVRTAFFEDHHRFTKEEAERLAADLRDGEWAVCTLKDYVKLAPLWPASATAFGYVSQRVVPESGDSALSNAIDSVLHARSHQH
jgi:tetraacyldisaccharide 4'-kinase